jgi:hypothetical protein
MHNRRERLVEVEVALVREPLVAGAAVVERQVAHHANPTLVRGPDE